MLDLLVAGPRAGPALPVGLDGPTGRARSKVLADVRVVLNRVGWRMPAKIVFWYVRVPVAEPPRAGGPDAT